MKSRTGWCFCRHNDVEFVKEIIH